MGTENLWREISALSVLGVAIFTGLGWVYKQLSRLIAHRFDEIDNKLLKAKKQAKKARRLAQEAMETSKETQGIVARSMQENNIRTRENKNGDE